MAETMLHRKIAEVDLLDSSHALGKCGLFDMERKMQTFRASYEDAAKAEVAARKLGYTDNDSSLLDFVEAADYCTGKTFNTLAEAEAWLKSEIDAMKTMFGCGDIRALEPVERRCRYCTCRGVKVVHEYLVEDTGIVSDEATRRQKINAVIETMNPASRLARGFLLPRSWAMNTEF